jgi:hypothetical protein
MIYSPNNTAIPTCPTGNWGGRRWDNNSTGLKNLKLLTLMWRLLKIFFRYGNQEIFYHICGSLGKDCYDVPMDAENVEVRLTKCGPKVTLW